MLIPEAFRMAIAGRTADAAGYLGGDDWLARVPSLVEEHLDRWELTLDGPPWHGENAVVFPVLHEAQTAVLKVTWPHPEARHEHLALRLWDGRGAVRLIAAHPSASTLLLERLDGDRPLTELPILEACEVVGELMQQLDRPPVPQLDTVADKAIRWQDQLREPSVLVPRRLTHQANDELKALVASAPPARLVHEDLHDMNVLAPLAQRRGDWLAIDPKPVAGEWAYAVAPIVWNRSEVTAAAFSVRNHVRMRAEVVADVAGLDEDRVRRWTFVRLVLNAVWAAVHTPRSDDFRTRMILLAKAFSD
ncbi:aminoglycoside phosphotransferase family protein [Tessaracoccus antarcticus]|uniref:Kinase n=1 Tax=Tessaracoccus antarcticus TaxID=2479848 RepID=A0A3M0GKV7_9ACTN|nr:aminoglycoside phosphotransferase family protein [Tessaracoccus antarcticus]RMB61779.1 kinase [Tessaracoccus antarcticus]